MKFGIHSFFLFVSLCVFIPPGTAFAGGGLEKGRTPIPATENLTGNETNSLPNETVVQAAPGSETAADRRGETVMNALANAYPDRAESVEYLDGDWSILVYGERFYFSGGRLLPSSLRDKANEYSPHPFYAYQRELPHWIPPSAEESARMMEQDRARETNRTQRSSHFFDAIWRTRNRDESWEHIKQIRFLGRPIQVHYSILVHLSLVEERILRTAKTNAAVQRWIDSLNVIESWNWRNIASSQTRSYHAYGAAIDLLPKSLGGLETYWLWTANSNQQWWNIPYSRRFHPPDEVVKAFESFGFVWGGKWRYYDTMHFEYRPEIMILSGMDLMNFRDLR